MTFWGVVCLDNGSIKSRFFKAICNTGQENTIMDIDGSALPAAAIQDHSVSSCPPPHTYAKCFYREILLNCVISVVNMINLL